MIDIDTLWKGKTIIKDKLLSFGFLESERDYSYTTNLIPEKFNITISITKDNKLSTQVIELESQEEYILHRIPLAEGEFIGKIREEYEKVLTKIIDTCFDAGVFKNYQTKQVIDYIRQKYRNELEFLWPKFPDNAIARRSDNAKWYIALLTINKRKLGLDSDESIEIINLRGHPDDIQSFINGITYFPGYHMNKKHWYTICLNGSVSFKEICERIDTSFTLTKK